MTYAERLAAYALETQAVVYVLFALAVIFAILLFHCGMAYALQLMINHRLRVAAKQKRVEIDKERARNKLLVSEIERLRGSLATKIKQQMKATA